MKLISEITSLVLVLYVFACLVDGFQMRRDRQIMRGGVCVGFMAVFGMVLGSAMGLLVMNQSSPSLLDPINWAVFALPFVALLASFFVVSERTIAVLVAGSALITALMLTVFQPVYLLRLSLPALTYLVPVATPVVIIGAFFLSRSRWFLANIRLIATFICANYILSTVLGYIVNKLVAVPKSPDFSLPVLPVAASYVSAIAAWFIAQAIARRFEPQTSSVTSEA